MEAEDESKEGHQKTSDNVGGRQGKSEGLVSYSQQVPSKLNALIHQFGGYFGKRIQLSKPEQKSMIRPRCFNTSYSSHASKRLSDYPFCLC